MLQAESTQLTASSIDLQTAIREFVLVLRGKGCVTDTIERYQRHLTALAKWLAKRDVTHLSEITPLLLREWVVEIQERPDWSATTARVAASIVHSFLGWCHQEELITRRILDSLTIPKAKTMVQRTMSEDEIQRMLDSCDDTPMGIRNAALIAMLYDTGFRASEICRLELDGLYFDAEIYGQTVNYCVVETKGGDEQFGFFEAEARAYLERWLDIRVAKPGVNTVFVSLGGNTPGSPLTRFGLRSIVERMGENCGVAGATPHAFRRAFACALDDAGASSNTIAKLGRWSDIRLVQRYTQARQAGRQFHLFSPMKRLKRRKDGNGNR